MGENLERGRRYIVEDLGDGPIVTAELAAATVGCYVDRTSSEEEVAALPGGPEALAAWRAGDDARAPDVVSRQTEASDLHDATIRPLAARLARRYGGDEHAAFKAIGRRALELLDEGRVSGNQPVDEAFRAAEVIAGWELVDEPG